MTFFKNILIICALTTLCTSDARQIGRATTPAPQPTPAKQPIVAPAPQKQAPVPQTPVQPAVAPAKPVAQPKSFSDYITQIRTAWKPADVINNQGIFTDKFIDFVLSARFDTTLVQTLLEAGKNLYLPLPAGNEESMNILLAADEMIETAIVAYKNPFYDPKTNLFKQDYLDRTVGDLDPTVTNAAALDKFRDSMLESLHVVWGTIGGAKDTASLTKQAHQQINASLEKYGLIKPIAQPAAAQPQPKPAPQQQKPEPKPAAQQPKPQPVTPPTPAPAQPAAQPAAKPAAQPAAQVAESLKIGNTLITFVKGSLLDQKVDAIVNAANENLNHGGGIAGAISQAAGPELQDHCNKMLPYPGYNTKCPAGKAVITPPFNLASRGIKKIIHTTGPYGTDSNKVQLLTDAYKNSLQVAMDNNLKSIAFVPISTAIFGYNIDEATPVAFAAVRDFIKQNPNAFNEVRFALFDYAKDLPVYRKWIDKLKK